MLLTYIVVSAEGVYCMHNCRGGGGCTPPLFTDQTHNPDTEICVCTIRTTLEPAVETLTSTYLHVARRERYLSGIRPFNKDMNYGRREVVRQGAG